MNKAEKIIQQLQLEPHPEGGYFKETYRSTGKISQENLGSDYSGTRNYSTSIYFLLTSDKFSAFHRIKQDEFWHFYDGSSLRLHMISDIGDYSNVIIGRDLDKQEVPQFVVPGGYWFAAEVINKNDFSLVGCTVSPGFDFADFELPGRKVLASRFPKLSQIINKLTNE